MEIKKSLKVVKFLILGAILITPVFSYGYGNEKTHPALTNETVDVFNEYYPDLEIGKERKFIEKGSIEEDKPETRCINHFYDPISGKGLLGVNLSSKKWSQNTRAQAGFSSLAGIGVIKDLFSSNSDFSWDRAVYEYVYGDKERALESLGHVLHLIQDITVPPHTRNDQHMTDPSPYEVFTKDFDKEKISNLSNILINKNRKPVIEQSLDTYFYKLASFTNKNFFSASTLPDNNVFYNNYTEPLIDFEKVEVINGNRIDFGYKKVLDVNIKLVEIYKTVTKQGEEIKYYLDRTSNLILKDYWNILSEQAVLNGAGVIKLFFDEVEKEKETLALYYKNKSALAKIGDSILETGKSFAKIVYNSVNRRDTENNLAIISGATKQKDTPESVEKPVDNPMDNTGDSSMDNLLNTDGQDQTPPPKKPQENEANLNQDTEPEGIPTKKDSGDTNPPLSSQQITSNFIGFGGGGSSTSLGDDDESSPEPEPEPEPEPVKILINPPTITIPINNQKFATTTIVFTGNASSTNIILTDFSNSTTTVSGTEDWSLILDNFNQGTTTVNFYASNQEQTATSTPTLIEFFIDSNAPDISLNIPECQRSLSQSGCLLATSTVNINPEWSSSANDFDYFILDQNGQLSTTTATTTQITLSGNQKYTFKVSSVDSMGNISNEAVQEIEINNLPVVINEVAWAGTSAVYSSDEWIELYNNTDQDINLENWTLYAEDNTPYIPLSGIIKSKDFFLLERTDDTTISDILADQIYTGSLGNSGEYLILAKYGNNATTTIDSVVKVKDWARKGSSRYYKSMERNNSLEQSGANLENWSTAMGEFILNGQNATSSPILGTPKAKNSVSYLISSNGSLNLTKENSPYIVGRGGFTVNVGETLEIDSGVVIKFVVPNNPSLIVKGAIKSNGASNDPVVFTSFLDDEYGGDLNNDGICDPANASSTSACPSAGNWKQILIEPSGQNSSFSNTIVRYGGAYFSRQPVKYKAMVSVEGTDIVIANSIFENSLSKGMYLFGAGSGTIISGSIFRDNNYVGKGSGYNPYGLYISGDYVTVNNNLFENNKYGLVVGGSSSNIIDNEFKGNTGYAISTSAMNIVSGNTGLDNGINGILIGGNLTTVNATSTLKYNPLPYVVKSHIIVTASSTLVIDPKVVIKFDNRHLEVLPEGRLEMNGEVGSEILFTSVVDDSDGNDAYNNGTSTPTIRKFTGTFMRASSTSQIKNTEFRYMKYATSYENSPISLENVIYRNNELGVYVGGSSPIKKAINIEFMDNTATSTIPLN